MKDFRTVLRAGDPLAAPEEREGLPPARVAAMRRLIVTAAQRPGALRTPWQQPLGIAAMLALAIAAGVVGGQRLAPPAAAGPELSVGAPANERRQFQFSTPGGTRIIWVFDPEFQVKETVP
jgi:hypothetical protein